MKAHIPQIKKHMRLLIGIPDPDSLGGPAACEPPFIAELRKQGLEVEEEVYVYGDRLFPTAIEDRVSRVARGAFRLRRKLNSGSFDLLHLNTSFDTRALLRDVVTLGVIGRRAKIFLKFHGGDSDLLKTRNPILKLLVDRVLRRADGIAVLSTEEKQNFIKAGWDEHKFFVIKNVVDRSFPARNGRFNSQHGLAEGLPTLLFIARFIPAKGLLDLIDACALLRDKRREFALVCVGDGPTRAGAQAAVEKLGLQSYVRFTGFIPEDQTAPFYANSEVMVLPTYHYEGFPMSVFNGVAAGLPVVTTRIRGAADHLAEPDNCLWVEPRNPGMLAEKLEFLLDNPSVRHAMSEANRKLALKFSAAVVTREYLEVYRELIERGGVARDS